MSTPTTLPANTAVAGKGRPKRKADELEEIPPTPQLKAQGKSFKETNAAKRKRIKLAARNLLTTLSTKRISVTNISFVESGFRHGGTFADIAIATFARTTRHGQEGRLAVKKLRFVIDSNMTEEKLFKLFANELRLLDGLSHPNIVRIIGFVEDMRDRIAWLLFPWEDNGNLREFLRSGTWEIPERVSLIIDVADGLKYLHTRQPPVCHGDLKSLNILVNSSHRAVITDFGSARVIGEAQGLRATSPFNPAASAKYRAEEGNERPELKVTVSNTAFTLTGPAWSFRWAAPEVLQGSPPDLASDVWALGWIAWEAITDRYPFEELASEPQVTMKLTEGYLPSIYKHHQLSHIHMLCGVMQNCWRLNPTERPSAAECWQAICWIPNIIPLIKRGEVSRPRSAALLLQIGDMHRFQNRREEASKAFEEGLAIARLTGDVAALEGLLIGLARNYQAQSRQKEAEKSYTEALAISRGTGNYWSRAKALNGLGDVQQARSKYIEAESSYAEALSISKRIGNGVDQAHALLGLGAVQRARSEYIEAEAAYAEALAIYKSIGNDLGRANVLHSLGEIQRARSKYIEAESSYAEALAIYKSIGDDLGRANALRRIGDVQQARSESIEAESSYAEALTIYKSVGNDLGRANTLLGLGDVQQARSKSIEAQSSYAEAFAIYKSIGNDLGQANALCGLGDIQRARSKYIEAESSYAEALVIHKSIGHDLGRANALHGLGDVQLGRSKYIEAESSYAEALAIYKSIRVDLGQGNALCGLGAVRRARSEYIEAEAAYVEALAIYESIGHDWGRANALRGLGDVQRARSKYIEAESSYAEVLTIYKSIGADLDRGNALCGLGDVQLGRSNYIKADSSYTEALAIYKHIGSDHGQVNSSLRLAEVRLHQARYAEAKALVDDATPIAERMDYGLAVQISKALVQRVLESERSSIGQLSATPSTSQHAQGSNPPAPLPLLD